MADIEDLIERLDDEAMRLHGRGIDRGCVDSSLAGNLALEVSSALSAQQREIAELRSEREEAYAAMRWVYENGMRPDYDRPQRVSAAFNDAFASVRAALNTPSQEGEKR